MTIRAAGQAKTVTWEDRRLLDTQRNRSKAQNAAAPPANRGRRAVDGRELADAGAPWPRRCALSVSLPPPDGAGG
jgi:hypothetical protein